MVHEVGYPQQSVMLRLDMRGSTELDNKINRGYVIQVLKWLQTCNKLLNLVPHTLIAQT